MSHNLFQNHHVYTTSSHFPPFIRLNTIPGSEVLFVMILSADDFNHFLNTLDIPKLSTDQIILCDIELTEKDLYDSMKSMKNDKSPGNDGLTKEFNVTFWDDIKQTLFLL